MKIYKSFLLVISLVAFSACMPVGVDVDGVEDEVVDSALPTLESLEGEGYESVEVEEEVVVEEGDAEADAEVEELAEDMEIMTAQTINDHYVDYTDQRFSTGSLSKRVLFFHAAWCPTCIAANANFEAGEDSIPEDVVVLKVDYDTQKELKAKYGITYQHTFVYVDAKGEAIKVWNGGDLAEVINNTK